MLFKYFVNFDDEGEIKCFCISKAKCDDKNKDNCKEYIVELTEIKRRSNKNTEVMDLNVNKLTRSMTGFSHQLKSLDKSLSNANRDLKKIVKGIKRK